MVTHKFLGKGYPVVYIYSNMDKSIIDGSIKYKTIIAPKNCDCDFILR